MATVNNVVMANVVKGSGIKDIWRHMWAGTRAMKKAGWKVLAGSDGTTKTVSDDPGLDEWGAGAITNAGASAASTGAIAGGRMTVTGLTGIVAADKGRFLRLSSASSAGNNHHHQIEEILGATSVRVDARRSAFTPVASDASNGSIVWEILDPTTESHPVALDTVVAWILMAGPSTVKVPITSAPVDGGSGFTFIRGENVSQATTGAEGEILGYVFDADASSGYLVISPRIIGSGGDPLGWATTNVITGATSGATVTQVGAATEYRQEAMIRKFTTESQGSMYVQCVDPVGETAADFETLAAAAGCTATVHPGGGGTGNGFPTIAYVALGVGASTSAQTWLGSQQGTPQYGNGQIIAADAIFEEDYSADGTWAVCTAVLVTLSTATGGPYGAVGMFRMDDTEPGDLDPWATLYGGNATLYTTLSRTSLLSSGSTAFDPDYCSSGLQNLSTIGSGFLYWHGWRRRGLGTEDGFTGLEMSVEYGAQSADFFITVSPTSFDGVASEPVSTQAREPIRLTGNETNAKIRKGTVRRLSLVQNGNPNRTLDGGKLLQLHNINGCFVIGPWDETSVPRSG